MNPTTPYSDLSLPLPRSIADSFVPLLFLSLPLPSLSSCFIGIRRLNDTSSLSLSCFFLFLLFFFFLFFFPSLHFFLTIRGSMFALLCRVSIFEPGSSPSVFLPFSSPLLRLTIRLPVFFPPLRHLPRKYDSGGNSGKMFETAIFIFSLPCLLFRLSADWYLSLRFEHVEKYSIRKYFEWISLVAFLFNNKTVSTIRFIPLNLLVNYFLQKFDNNNKTLVISFHSMIC